METAEVLALSLVIADKGTDEDVRWAYDRSNEMVEHGDEGPAWWIQQMRERFPWA